MHALCLQRRERAGAERLDEDLTGLLHPSSLAKLALQLAQRALRDGVASRRTEEARGREEEEKKIRHLLAAPGEVGAEFRKEQARARAQWEVEKKEEERKHLRATLAALVATDRAAALALRAVAVREVGEDQVQAWEREDALGEGEVVEVAQVDEEEDEDDEGKEEDEVKVVADRRPVSRWGFLGKRSSSAGPSTAPRAEAKRRRRAAGQKSRLSW
jgi:hypothetical protein